MSRERAVDDGRVRMNVVKICHSIAPSISAVSIAATFLYDSSKIFFEIFLDDDQLRINVRLYKWV
jgi:hypothetical protein